MADLFCRQKIKSKPNREDFLEVTLENEDIVLNAMHIIQKDFPNAISIPPKKSLTFNNSKNF